MEKKIYYIPTIEIVKLNTERMMGTAEPSGHSDPHSAPPRRDPVF